jgi:hypothetical protein
MKNISGTIMTKIPHTAKVFLFGIVTALIFTLGACDESDENPPLAYINITIDPNSTIYDQLNTVGGWMYLDETDGVVAPSRGLIVYRASTDMFMAYDRTPPYKADSCCNPSKTSCTRLLVGDEYPFVADTCTNSRYLILDGSPVSGPSINYLYTYVAEYDGYTLYIHN